MPKNYKNYLYKKLFIPSDYKFSSVEHLLDEIKENRRSEDWKETAIRLKSKYPDVSKYLFKAYNKF